MIGNGNSGSTVRELGNQIADFKFDAEFFYELTVTNRSRDVHKRINL
jgi:hypothetical protein